MTPLENKLVDALEEALTLIKALETCHKCNCLLVVEEGPIHCEDCSSDCNTHEPPDCPSIESLHELAKQSAQAVLREAREQPGWRDERVQVRAGWGDAGREAICLTDSFASDGQVWVTLQWLDDLSEEGIDTFKVSGLISVELAGVQRNK